MKKVSDKVHPIELKGMILPFNAMAKRPVFLELNDGTVLLPVFSSIEKFEEGAQTFGIAFSSPKIIVNAEEFIESVREYKKQVVFHVVSDPYITAENNTRFQMLVLDEPV